MLDRQKGKFVVECDSCPEVLDTETSDFPEALDMMKREGWNIRKIAGEWLHGCPKCGAPA
jgi:hypothetical protein